MKYLYISILLLLYNSPVAQSNECRPVNLRCDYIENPIGIDNPTPRLSWMLQDKRSGAKQCSYRIIVDIDSISVKNGDGKIWDTQKVNSDKMLQTYSGRKLAPFTKYYWAVHLQDKNGNLVKSDIACFETGMMCMNNWKGTWISDKNDIHYRPAPYFRKEIMINKIIKSARIYIAVAGLYELYINGEKIGNQRLNPMYTRFDCRNLYLTHNVTTQLQKGANVIGVLLGNGWNNHQPIGVWGFERAPWRSRPTFCLDLRIEYNDGTTEIIATDKSWRTSTDGPLIFNSIYTAEHYDARLQNEGWSTVAFDDSQWNEVINRSAPSTNITAQQLQPIRNVEALPVQKMAGMNDTTFLFDLGRNIAGVTKVKLSGKRGTIVKLKHGERLHKDGSVDLSNINVYHKPTDDTDPFQTDILILSGNKTDEFMPKFNYKGFRYVELTSNQPLHIDKDCLTGYFMHSDVTQHGYVNTSNKLINDLWKATNNSYLSNLMGYPTDCPQREKNGWTGDGHLAIETALYNFDGITIYEKWLADHIDEQQPYGVLPDIIPTGGWGYGGENGLDWTSTIAIIPWNIYLFYGDSKLLSDCYDNIKRYVDYVNYKSPNGLTAWGRGDWVPVKSKSNIELTSSIYFYVDASILANAAKLFGKTDDYKYYSTLAEKIKNAINKKYLNMETGIYASGTQTEQSMPLQWGVVPKDMKAKVAHNLSIAVEQTGFHLDVGVLGAKAILNALSENGYAETAYKIATQDTYPSWGWWIVNGATTLVENWDLAAKQDISDNHMMFGEIGGWFFKTLGGIRPDSEQPGFKHILLKPHFINELEYSEVKHLSPHGWIISEWKRKGKKIIYNIEIPANSTATFTMPDEIKEPKEVTLTAGKHQIKMELK